MSRQTTFQRKIVYLVCICIILGLLVLSNGDLSRRREENGLAQAKLGKIDPTSETIKLATLGMRGVAANLLWGKAHEYQKKKDYTNLSATLEQIVRVQPNFISVWRYQAWNLSYNVSVQFDDFRDRYHWVIAGIDFLKKGIGYNPRSPRLVSEVGWFISQKIGRSDEHRQFRKLFKEDDDFHGSRPVGLRDNWLVGKEWYLKAEDMIAKTGNVMTGKSPLMLYSDAPMCQMYYAEALEKDGKFGETAKVEWSRASAEWNEYGDREIATSFEEVPFIRLNDLEAVEKDAAELGEQLEPLIGTLRKQIQQEKQDDLTDEEREVLGIEPDERSAEQQAMAVEAERKIEVTHKDIADRLKGPHRAEAIKLIKQLKEKETVADVISRYRHQVNFDYWKSRAELEQDDLTLKARKLIYDGGRAFADGELEPAREYFDEGLQTWRKVLDKYPFFVSEPIFRSDMEDILKVYRRLLDLRDEKFPEPFILQDMITPLDGE